MVKVTATSKMAVTTITAVSGYTGATKTLYEMANAGLYSLTGATTVGNTTTYALKAGVTLASSAALTRRAGITITFVTEVEVTQANAATRFSQLNVTKSADDFVAQMTAVKTGDASTYSSVAVPLAAALTITAPTVASVAVVSSAATVTTSVMAMAVAALAASQARQ